MTDTEWMPIKDASLKVRMQDLSESQAQTNHNQSLERLRERGDVSCSEAAALVEGRHWKRMIRAHAINYLSENAKVKPVWTDGV